MNCSGTALYDHVPQTEHSRTVDVGSDTTDVGIDHRGDTRPVAPAWASAVRGQKKVSVVQGGSPYIAMNASRARTVASRS